MTCSHLASHREYCSHAPCDLERRDQLRAGQHPDQAFQRRLPQERPLQPDRQAHGCPHPVPQGVGRGRRGGARRADRQGLPAQLGRVRDRRGRRAAALDPEATRSIDIEQFVDLDEIDPIYYDSAYYVAPDGAARKPYALLVRAMEEAGKVAIARFVMRSKQYLAALRPKEGVLVMSTMVYADEVNDATELVETSRTSRSRASCAWRPSWSSRCPSRSSPSASRTPTGPGPGADRPEGGRQERSCRRRRLRRRRSSTSGRPRGQRPEAKERKRHPSAKAAAGDDGGGPPGAASGRAARPGRPRSPRRPPSASPPDPPWRSTRRWKWTAARCGCRTSTR